MTAIVIACFIILADQLSKYLVLNTFVPGESLALIPNVFHISLVLNKGFAFGLFSQKGTLFIWCVYSLAIIICAFALYKKQFLKRKSTSIFTAMVIAGALGNLIDRVRFSAVVDFIDFRIWPVFNIADTAISVGIGLLIIQILRLKHKGT